MSRWGSRREKSAGRRLKLLIFVLLSVFCIIFFAARGKFETPVLSRGVSVVLTPFQEVVSWIGSRMNQATAGIWEIATVYEQNQLLRSEIEELREQNLQASEFEAENERLRALLNYKKVATRFDLVAARVIGREAATWSSMIVINQGTMAGVHENMPVVTSKGLVGRVTEAGPLSSEVQLILDPRSSVGTLVQRAESRVAGIVKGDIGNPTMPRMVNIPKTADVVEEDVIVTSGYGGIYPKGIVVGKVHVLENETGGLLKYGVIEPSVDFQKLEDVAVIVQSREAPPEPMRNTAQPVDTGSNSAEQTAGGTQK